MSCLFGPSKQRRVHIFPPSVDTKTEYQCSFDDSKLFVCRAQRKMKLGSCVLLKGGSESKTKSGNCASEKLKEDKRENQLSRHLGEPTCAAAASSFLSESDGAIWKYSCTTYDTPTSVPSDRQKKRKKKHLSHARIELRTQPTNRARVKRLVRTSKRGNQLSRHLGKPTRAAAASPFLCGCFCYFEIYICIM